MILQLHLHHSCSAGFNIIFMPKAVVKGLYKIYFVIFSQRLDDGDLMKLKLFFLYLCVLFFFFFFFFH